MPRTRPHTFTQPAELPTIDQQLVPDAHANRLPWEPLPVEGPFEPPFNEAFGAFDAPKKSKEQHGPTFEEGRRYRQAFFEGVTPSIMCLNMAIASCPGNRWDIIADWERRGRPGTGKIVSMVGQEMPVRARQWPFADDFEDTTFDAEV